MSDALTDLALLVRLGVAFLLSGVIGWERELGRKSAGLRTHIFVGVSSALFMVLAERLVAEYAGEASGVRFDLVGVLGAVVSGISFLGAGAIFSNGRGRKGLTTAASLLGTAAIGVSCGLQHHILAAGVTLIFIVTLRGVGLLEARLFSNSTEDDEGGGKGEG